GRRTMSVSRINLPRLSGESIAAKPAKGFGIDGNDSPPPLGGVGLGSAWATGCAAAKVDRVGRTVALTNSNNSALAPARTSGDRKTVIGRYSCHRLGAGPRPRSA